MTYVLGIRSLVNLKGVHPDLERVVQKAITLTAQDFGVAGKASRTAAEQHALYEQGRTKPGDIVTSKDGYKNKSNHQNHSDGFGHAVDLTPFIAGQFNVNNEAAQYPIAVAMSIASKALGVPITWGGNWMRPLTGSTIAAIKDLARMYRLEHPGPDWQDWPHFELRHSV